MSLTEEQIADLVMALMAVNQYPLSKAASLMPAFKARGLLQPKTVLAMSQEQLIEQMKAAGYDRGGYLPIISFRMYPLMESISSGDLDILQDYVKSGNKDEFRSAITKIHGFGPKVADSVWMLWTSSRV